MFISGTPRLFTSVSFNSIIIKIQNPLYFNLRVVQIEAEVAQSVTVMTRCPFGTQRQEIFFLPKTFRMALLSIHILIYGSPRTFFRE
jgi:hypothetical protein